MKSLSQRRQMKMQKDSQERSLEDLELFEAWMPILREIGSKPGQMTAQEIVDRFGPLGPLVLAQAMLCSKSDRVRVVAAKEMAYMHGLKPVERSQNLNVSVMAEGEAKALLRSKLSELGCRIIEDGGECGRALDGGDAVLVEGGGSS